MTKNITLVLLLLYGLAHSQNSSTLANRENDVQKLVSLLDYLEGNETNPLLKKHFVSVKTIMLDTTHDAPWTKEDSLWVSSSLEFFKNEGAKWETYQQGPRPLMMSFESPSDGKNSFYWLFLPKNFKPSEKKYPFYMELHGSGGGQNNNPRKMLFDPLRPEISGVTSQGYRKEGLFILPWGRGDKGYRDQAELDIFECLAHFDKLFKTDKKRQYLYGFSMGGAGTYRIAGKTPERWSAVGIYSGTAHVRFDEFKKLKKIPIWLAWGEKERFAKKTVELKEYLIEIGAEVKWHEIKGVGHHYIGKYQEDLMDWFNNKEK